jgi:isopentenyl diphosphate isomerase/L-lactate dehydrogenase-like FMN-dependent dehydrogenase
MKLSATRREAIRNFAAFVAGSPLFEKQLLEAQQDPARDQSRIKGLRELETTFDFEPIAFAKLTRSVYDYTAYGSGGEFTLRRNREAYDWVELIPAAASGSGAIQTATNVLGTPMPYPMLVSPSAAQGQLHPEGESGMRKGATAASNTPMIVSNNSTQPFAKVATGPGCPLWVQLYPKQDLEVDKAYLGDASAAGARAVVVTVDQQAPVYERALRGRNLNGTFGVGGGRGGRGGVIPLANNPYRLPTYRLWYEWKFFDEIRAFVKIPVLAKGILTGEDALLCLEHGVDAIYVSNHGGRSLDYSPSTFEVLPEIVDAVRGRVPVVFDGGIRRGTDILKALALGANAVCIGRAVRWGLAAYGPDGVQKVLEILQAELKLAMMQTGRTTLASLDRKIEQVNFK